VGPDLSECVCCVSLKLQVSRLAWTSTTVRVVLASTTGHAVRRRRQLCVIVRLDTTAHCVNTTLTTAPFGPVSMAERAPICSTTSSAHVPLGTLVRGSVIVCAQQLSYPIGGKHVLCVTEL
jgi:hypothetical protein